MKNLIAQGIARKLIRFEDNEKYIVYIHQNKRRNFDNPEEKVQADAFLTLVIDYQYPVGQILEIRAWPLFSHLCDRSCGP